MTMKQFRDATEHVPDDAPLIIDFGNGQLPQEGEIPIYTISVKTIEDGDENLSMQVVIE